MSRTFVATLLLILPVFAFAASPQYTHHASNNICMSLSKDMLNNMEKGDFVAVSKLFDKQLKTLISAQKIKMAWEKALPQMYGSFEGSTTPKKIHEGNKTGVLTRLQFSKHWGGMLVFCNAKGQISGFGIRRGTPPAASAYDASNGIPWVSFQWSPLTSGGKTYSKGALLVPVRIRSHPETYYMQLDTGFQDTIFYAVPKSVQDALGTWHKGQPFYLPLHIGDSVLTFSGIRIKGSTKADMRSPHPTIGTLGQNAFQNLVVFIDFVHQRIAFMSPGKVRRSDLKGVSFVHMIARDGELFIPVTIDGISYPNDFYYDSGSSIFPLITTRKVWKQLLGRAPKASKDAVLKVNQWGKLATMVGAKINGALSIGPVKIHSPMAWVHVSGGRKDSTLADALIPRQGHHWECPVFDLLHDHNRCHTPPLRHQTGALMTKWCASLSWCSAS